MKNLSLILSGVLLVAVAVLFYLHFAGTKGQSSGGTTPIGDLKIAYIHSDSVLKNYDYFKLSREKLEAKGKKLDLDLQGRAQSLQAEFDSYQRNANNLTPNQNAIMQEELGKKRQNLQMYQESLSQEMVGEQERITKDLYDRVTSYLDIYGKEKGLQVVLKYNPTSDLLYANTSLDISKDVIKGLNESYKTELASPAKKDSAAVKK
ncbi:OmpH family outer membrane protein [soil metagenome]